MTIVDEQSHRQQQQQQRLLPMHYHFVLVHGSCHGAWCWYKLAALLNSAGHHVTALDLGGSGDDHKKLKDIRSLSDYLQPLMQFMSSLPQDEKVVLVGHSYGGISISLAMENFSEKISVAIFLTAYMPQHGCPPAVLVREYFKRIPAGFAMDSEVTFEDGPENLPTSVLFGPNFMKRVAYHHSKPEDLELAKMRVRPSKLFLMDLDSESLLTEERYGSVKRVFILCLEDVVVKQEFQQWMIDNYTPDEMKVIKGAGHMAMLSKTKELCLLLEEIAQKYS